MRDVLRNGNTQARVNLSDVIATPGGVAVGALAGLGGEITIVDGEVWVARSTGSGAKMSGPDVQGGDCATLLTVSHVDAWVEVPLPQGGAGAGLATAIAAAAKRQGLDTAQPFPFVIEGELTELDAHVIAGSCPIANPDGEAPWKFSLSSPTTGRLVGFYAEDSEGVMTHHGSLTHTHVVLPRNGSMVTAHADHAAVAPGAMLRIPAY
jgi:acetolactate decarboxylase